MNTHNDIDSYSNEFNAADELAYQDEIVEQLQENIAEFLTFGTSRDLIKIVADML